MWRPAAWRKRAEKEGGGGGTSPAAEDELQRRNRPIEVRRLSPLSIGVWEWAGNGRFGTGEAGLGVVFPPNFFDSRLPTLRDAPRCALPRFHARKRRSTLNRDG